MELPPGGVVLVGGNAQGKSNFLEAIYLLALTRSHRAETERELIRWGAEGWARVDGEGEGRQGKWRIEVVFQRPGEGPVSKLLRVNGLPRRSYEAVGVVAAVMFCAEDIGLVNGPPALRRRYLDLSGSLTDRRYYQALQRYQRVLAQRNSLLRLIREGQGREEELDFWDEALSTEGGYIIGQRRRLAAALAEAALPIHRRLTQGQENLQILYLPNPPDPSPQAFREALIKGRPREIAQGATQVGPHRDDLQFLVNGVDMATYGSRGQLRTIALSAKLAEGEWLRQLKGEPPLLLLDDVLSELDQERRHQLLDSLGSYDQYLLTTTDLSTQEAQALDRAALFRIVEGTVQPP